MSLTEFSTHSNLLERQARMIRAIETGDERTLDNELMQLDKIQIECMLYGDITAIVEHRTALLSKINAMGDRNAPLQIKVIGDKSLSLQEACEIVCAKRHLKKACVFDECVFDNLMKFRPWEMHPVKKALGIDVIITTWLENDQFEFALPLLDELLLTTRHPQGLQAVIIDALKKAAELTGRASEPQKPFLQWAVANQQAIINLDPVSVPCASDITYDVGLSLASAELHQLAEIIIRNSDKIPDQGELCRLRLEAGIILSDEKILALWKQAGDTSQLQPGKIIALTMYTMAFEDAPIPPEIHASFPDRVLRDIDDSMRILTDCNVPHDPTRIGFLLDYWWHATGRNYKALKAQSWPDEMKLSCEGYRTHQLEVDMSL
ncbi:hypothetical protein DV532_27385 (plasmid) [Pseudomonas sp. Leaf58]|uniref:hypothetical protein n=1 Tax=Pseudomonas sp. Leaf58 TaxID=1736226 RepID=UPI0006F64748|nr:hypothetical protein [Pseudomonas sp. Leaf58]AYG48007.1 hypothetical protein DV532_27385 [Pseudomonas sp. Leaf58]KQN62434.1 hypothetical protein ASF02_09805 [Pseudomonas sp. Leaf58]